jgi:hypothetical protein
VLVGRAKGVLVPLLLGAVLMLAGWWLTLLQAMDFQLTSPGGYGPWAWVGLGLIALGAYLPWIQVSARRRRLRREQQPAAATAPAAPTSGAADPTAGSAGQS